MSISSEIARIRTAIAAAYTMIAQKGGTVPASATVANLASAIGTIEAAAEPYREDTVNASGKLTACSLHGYTNIPNYFMYYQTDLASITLPASVENIWGGAFQGCSGLTELEIPSGVASISGSAFKGCTGLTSVTFRGTPSFISSNVFGSDTNLTEINVPWSEGEVANAPWGATNATINYNYTGA